MSYFDTRQKLASTFIEPHYTKVDVDVAAFRSKFQAILDEIQDDMHKLIGDKSEPVNVHLATVHHTAFLVALDHATDHAIKYILAAKCPIREKT